MLCKMGEVTVITKEMYKGERLVPSDVVNGKCMFGIFSIVMD